MAATDEGVLVFEEVEDGEYEAVSLFHDDGVRFTLRVRMASDGWIGQHELGPTREFPTRDAAMRYVAEVEAAARRGSEFAAVLPPLRGFAVAGEAAQ